MDRLQLSILIRLFAEQLEKSIEESESLMPEDAKRELEKHYIGNNPIPFFDINPKNWEEKPTGNLIALEPIYNFLKQLRNKISILEEGIEITNA